jgi:iron complex outermembrane receptor protein
MAGASASYPPASFNSLFNEQQWREQTTDRHVMADVEYARALGPGRLTIRGAFDRFSYDGIYPNDLGTDDRAILVGLDHVLGSRFTASTRLTRPLPGRQVLTLGAEFIDNVHQNQAGQLRRPARGLVLVRALVHPAGGLRAGRSPLASWLSPTAASATIAMKTSIAVTPRAALIAMPSSNQSFKYLYGRAFRAPNLFERNSVYFGESTQASYPSRSTRTSSSGNVTPGDRLRTAVSLYPLRRRRADHPRARSDDLLGGTFVNLGRVQARGLEAEAQMRLGAGFQGVASYSFQRAENPDTGARLVNSPAQMAKVRLSVAGPWKGSTASTEVLAMSSRLTLAGNTLGPPHRSVTLLAPLRHGFELDLNARNLFDVQYSDPASSQHRQDDIPQNGRTFRIGVRWTLRVKD